MVPAPDIIMVSLHLHASRTRAEWCVPGNGVHEAQVVYADLAGWYVPTLRRAGMVRAMA